MSRARELDLVLACHAARPESFSVDCRGAHLVLLMRIKDVAAELGMEDALVGVAAPIRIAFLEGVRLQILHSWVLRRRHQRDRQSARVFFSRPVVSSTCFDFETRYPGSLFFRSNGRSQLGGTWLNIGSDLLKDTPTTTCSGNRKHKRCTGRPVSPPAS